MTQDLISSKFLTTDYEADEPVAPGSAASKSGNEIPSDPIVFRRARFPIGLMVICGFFVLISLMGMYSAINRMTALYIPKTESVDVSHLGSDSRSRRMKREIRQMEERAKEARAKFLPYMTYNELLKFGLAVSFAIAVGLFIVRYPKARKFAITVCFVALFYHVSAITITCMSTAEVLGPMGSFLDASASGSEEYQSMSAAEKEQAQQTFSRVMTGGFMLFVGIYLLIKVVFYGSCIFYLCLPEIKAMFDDRETDKKSSTPSSEPALQVG